MSSDILNRIEAKEKTCFTLDVFGKIIWKLQFLFEKSKPFIHFLNHRYLLFFFFFSCWPGIYGELIWGDEGAPVQQWPQSDQLSESPCMEAVVYGGIKRKNNS